MHRLFQLFCCNWSEATQQDIGDFDNTLLALDPPQNNNNNNNKGKLSDVNIQEEEQIIQCIFEILGQINEPSEEDMSRVLLQGLELIKQGYLRMAIIENLLETSETSERSFQNISQLIQTLDEKQTKELATLIHDLPPAVLGDSFAKEQSRVLIDLHADVREGIREGKAKLAKRKRLIDTVTEAFQQALSRLSPQGKNTVVVYVFSKQSDILKHKVIIQQLFTSKFILASTTSRERFLKKLNIQYE